MGSFIIDINNFQSIGKATLTFIPGINIIVGQSNSGKSAILRAINSVVTNPSRAKYFIKKGTNNTEVTLDFDNQEVTWARHATKGSQYIIDNETYEKMGSKTLFDLSPKCLGFVKDDDSNIMNIEGEWDLLFPFDRTPSELFKLFENIFCVSDSALILKSFKDEEAELVKKQGSFSDKLSILNEKYSALEELRQEVDLHAIEKKASVLSEHANTYFKMLDDVHYLNRCTSIAKITLDDKLPPAQCSLDAYVDCIKDYSFLETVIKRQAFYKSLPETIKVKNTLEDYLETLKDFRLLEEANALTQIDLSRNYSNTGETLTNYLSTIEDLQYITKADEVSSIDLSRTCDVDGDTLSKYISYVQDYKYIIECFKKRKAAKEQYDLLTAKIADLQAQLNEYKVCPLCGQTLKEGEVHVN